MEKNKNGKEKPKMKGFDRYWGYMIALWAIVLHSPVHSSEQCKDWAAKVQSLQGTVEIKTPSDQAWRNAELNQTLCTGDSVRLAARSRAAIRLQNETILRLNENSQIVLSSVSKKKSSWVNLIKGIAHFISRTPKSLEIKTPFVNAAIDGTEFVVDVDSNKSTVTVFEGQVTVSNENGKLILTNNQSAEATKGSAPQSKIILKPRNSVQWALYYPPIIDYQSSFIRKPEVKKIIDAFFVNDISNAFSQLDQLPETSNIANRLILRASLLLSVGQSKQAMQALDEALKKAPNMSSAFVLKSIIALTQGDMNMAKQFADKSNLVNPTSAVAKLALSYIAQANFDLESARSLTREASMLSPSSPLVWARLSEMELSFEELDLALDVAKKAVTLAPDYVHTQVTLGFAHLYQFESQTAFNVFTRAQKLAPYSPLANLGLGLSTIQIGDLDGGVKFLESAAIMDPNNSLLRSYLGKGYYEQNRFELAETELNIAKQLDKKDPTPYLYSAILYNVINNSALAIENLQKSIALNDNRAVFRSKQLLDQDFAARNASLSPIYGDLGFKQKALAESLKANDIDPTDFSAHRFLANAYALQPRHEIASASEFLQAQLLTRIHIGPTTGVSPTSIIPNSQLHENLMPLSNTLFSRNGSHSNFVAASGSNNTRFINANVRGMDSKFSYGLNYRDFMTDGFQENDNFNQSQQAFFFQYTIRHNFYIQYEYLSENLIYGDVPYRINEVHRTGLKQTEEKNEKRIGIRYSFNNKNTFLLSFTSAKLKAEEIDFNVFPDSPPGIIAGNLLEIKRKSDSKNIEFQYIKKMNLLNIISGLGAVDIAEENTKSHFVIFDGQQSPGFFDPVSIDSPQYNYNAYSYSYFSPIWSKLKVTLGLSIDRYRIKKKNKTQFNPKFGLVFPLSSTTLIRAATSRSIKRPIVSNKTIEPTNIAGFNQFYDGNNTSSSDLYGLALDQDFKSNIFFGLELIKRNIKTPVILDKSIINRTQNETSFRSYAYWVPNNIFAFSAELHNLSVDRERTSSVKNIISPGNINTLSIPVSLTIKIKHLYVVKLTTTYVDQKAIFYDTGSAETSYQDRFPVLDFQIEFKIPNKMGNIQFFVNNILNEKMKYQSTYDAATPKSSKFIPETTFFTKFNLYF